MGTTKDFSWGEWSDWSSCSMSCGHIGVRSRSRDCIDPVDGGKECPKKSDKQWESCGEPCWTDFTQWSPCKGAVCGEASQSRTRSCIENIGVPCPKTPWKHRPRSATPLDYS